MARYCFSCAESCQALCNYSNEEGVLVGTWYSLGQNKALKEGYRVCEIYEACHFEQGVGVVVFSQVI